MRGNNIVKICSIAGFFLAEIYMLWVVLAPYSPGKASRMFVPEFMIPKEPNVAPGTQPPLSSKITKIAVCAVFFGPFGAMAGCGVGLLLDGARRTFGGRREDKEKEKTTPPPTGGTPPAP